MTKQLIAMWLLGSARAIRDVTYWTLRELSRNSRGLGFYYRLDDESRQIRDLERRGNRCIDVPSAQREGVYFGFQGALNPVVADDSSSKVFIRKPHDNSKTTQNYCYKAMDDD